MHSPRHILPLFTLILFTAVALCGLHISMMADSHGNMGSCPLMQGTASICKMDVMAHIAGWQSTFAITVPVVLALLIALALILGSGVNFEDERPEIRYLYKNRNLLSASFDYLQKALSRGILHPKIYEFSPSAS